MERPGLKQLLVDIDDKRVDTIVVYKVDRLTRSLADFAKIVEALDARGVSFVSVTQQFNTTTSMGRLTLNVLLSFAQFEREVTGERIRDKIAASKRKGMRMGGRVPLGYDLKERQLVINQQEAAQVREMFRLYLETGCVQQLKERLDQKGIRSKIRMSRSERKSGGSAYSRGALYKILNNRIYLGEIPHKGNSYVGEHAAIIDLELWQRVQAKLAEDVHARRHGANAQAPSLLRGLLFDHEGTRCTPSHAIKNGKRYRYYVSQRITKRESADSNESTRIPAREIESLILARLREFFDSPDQVVTSLALEGEDVAITHQLIDEAGRFAQELGHHSAAHVNEMLAAIALRATVRRQSVGIEFHRYTARARLLGAAHRDIGDEQDLVSLDIPARLKRCKGEMRLIIPGPAANDRLQQPVPSLVKAISRAHEWVRRMEIGEFKDQRAIAAATGLDERYISHVLPSAFLAPRIVESILDGRHAAELNLGALLKNIPLNWTEQCGITDQ
jgi:site-specific DNA recombinase